MACAFSFIFCIALILVAVRCYIVSLQKKHLAKTESILANLSYTISKVTHEVQEQNLHIGTAGNMIRQVHDAAIARAKAELHSEG